MNSGIGFLSYTHLLFINIFRVYYLDTLARTLTEWSVGHSVMLKCKAEGAAPLKYTWLKEGKILRARILDPYLNTSIWYLKLKDLVPGDAGEYTCIVSNPYGSINHTYSVRVQGEYRRGWINFYPLFVKSFHLGIVLTLVIFLIASPRRRPRKHVTMLLTTSTNHQCFPLFGKVLCKMWIPP